MPAWNRSAIAAVAAVVTASGVLAATSPLGNDYPQLGPGQDDAGPQIDALIHGDLHRFFAEQSYLGPVSLVLRAPFAALAELGDGSILGQYRLGAFVCILALALVTLHVAALARREGVTALQGGALVGVALLSPPSIHALRGGHPEEFLTAALVLGAAIAVAGGRDRAAAVLVGLAIASKPWAALALAPIAAGTRAWMRTAGLAAAIAGLLLLPMVVVDTDSFRDAARGANDIGFVRPLNAWWPLSADTKELQGRTVTAHELPRWVEKSVRPALLALSIALALVAARRGPPRRDGLFALLALVLLVRCLLDPGTQGYYHVPFIAALGSWELLARRRAPVLAFIVGLLLSTRAYGLLDYDPDLRNALYLAWSLPMTAYLALAVRRSYAPPRVAPA
jgi:hypothetical protein